MLHLQEKLAGTRHDDKEKQEMQEIAHLDVHDGTQTLYFINKPQIDERPRLKEDRLESLLRLLERC